MTRHGYWCVIGIGLTCLMTFGGWGCVSNPQYRQGLEALELGDYDSAITHLKEASEKTPDAIEVMIALEQAQRAAATSCLSDANESMNAGNFEAAYGHLESAVAFDPDNPGLRDMFDELDRRQKAEAAFEDGIHYEKNGDRAGALQCYRNALSLVDSHQASAQKIAELEKPVGSAEPVKSVKVSFEIKDMAIGEVFEALAAVAGRNVLIDDTVDRTRPISLNLKEIDVNQAMLDIAASYGMSLIKLDSSTWIISTDAPENKERYSREAVRLFPLRYADAERVKELLDPVVGEAVILADKRTNSVVVRSRSDRMELVSDLVGALDIRESEVLVEVEILEVSRGKMSDLGVDFGNNPEVRGTLGGGVKSSGSGGRLTVSELSDITGGQVFLTVPSLYVKLLKNDSRTRILAQPRLRILNRTPARLHIGEQVPIKVTSSLFRNTSEELSAYSYRDVGILMNMTPRILSDTELALDLKLVVSSILQASEEGHPTIGTREVETTLRLRHGEVEIIAGLIKEDERKGRVSIPILGDVPVLGRLFRSHSEEVAQSDIVISLTPHILDRRTMKIDQKALWQGSPDSSSGKVTSGSVSADSSIGTGQDRIVLNSEKPVGLETDSAVSGSISPQQEENFQNVPTTVVSVAPEHGQVLVNQTAKMQITIAEAENVGSVPFYIDYDPTLLQIETVTEGSFMGSDGVSTVFLSSVDERRGRIIIGLSRLGPGKGISGTGVLVEMTVKGLRPGTSPFAFSHESLLDPMAKTIPARFVDGDISVMEAKP